MSIKSMWEKLSPSTQYQITSAIHTFLAAAIMEWALQAAQGNPIPDSKTAFFALASAIVRAGVKAVSMSITNSSEVPPKPPVV